MTYVIRFRGGPMDGQQMFAIDGLGWPPLPELTPLGEDGTPLPGTYRIGEHTQLTDEQMAEVGQALTRGAEYEWQQAEMLREEDIRLRTRWPTEYRATVAGPDGHTVIYSISGGRGRWRVTTMGDPIHDSPLATLSAVRRQIAAHANRAR